LSDQALVDVDIGSTHTEYYTPFSQQMVYRNFGWPRPFANSDKVRSLVGTGMEEAEAALGGSDSALRPVSGRHRSNHGPYAGHGGRQSTLLENIPKDEELIGGLWVHEAS
jgi:hypothetical protein